MTGHLRADSPLGEKWCSFLVAALHHARANGSDPYAAWPVSAISVNKLRGPLIYAAIARGECLYLGQTSDLLRTRIKRHLRDSKKAAAQWTNVLALELDEGVSASVIAELERRGRTIMDPITGTRWGRKKS